MIIPFAGETVHYVLDGRCHTAIVMYVGVFGVLDLMIYHSTGVLSRTSVAPAQDQRCGPIAGSPGTWHRPAPTGGVKAMVA